MADIDEFAISLLEEAKRFLERASTESDPVGHAAYLHAALLLAFCALEAHINAVAEEFAGRPELSPHEQGILLEKEVRLEDGEFRLKGLKIYRLEERFSFLHRKFSGKPVDKNAGWWSELLGAIDLRNRLTHPKQAQSVNVNSVQIAIRAIIYSIDALYRNIYKKGFPAATRGLQSRVDF